MSDNDHKLYWYEEVRELVVTKENIYLDNRPMNNRTLKAHKGLTNEIIFTVRDRDRRLQNMDIYELRAHLVDPVANTRLLTKMLVDTLNLGQVKLVLTEGDLINMDPGLYHIYITRQTNEVESLPLYKDQDNNVQFDIEITDQAANIPIPTQTVTEFIQTGNTNIGDPEDSFVSEALMGNVCRNFSNAQHSIAAFLDGYTGNIIVQGSCINNVPDSDNESNDWFDITTLTVSNAITQTHVFTNFEVNCNWVRIVSYPETGTITKLVLRN
jgi:hypothetical protein